MSESSEPPPSDSNDLLPTVVDTNLFVSGTIHKGGTPRRLMLAWLARRFRLLLSDEQRAELDDVFARPKIVLGYNVGREQLDELFAGLSLPTRVTLRYPLPLPVRDPKDEKILAAALGGADYLVTGDLDLLVLRDDPRLAPLRIVTATEFLAVLAERERFDASHGAGR